MAIRLRPAVFLDKDGTLIPDIPYNVDPERISLVPGAGEALRDLRDAGYVLCVVSNQSGAARGYFPEPALAGVRERLQSLVERTGAELAGCYFCPHHPEGLLPGLALACNCRKPATGLFERAARDLDIDLSRSWMVGDILDDIEAGRRAGLCTVLVDTGNETEWRMCAERTPHFRVRSLAEAGALIAKATRELATASLIARAW